MSAIAADGSRNMLAVLRFRQKDHTAASARAADFGRQGPLPQGHGNELFDHGSTDPWSIGLAQLPFFADQLGHLFPVGHGKSMVHGASDFADPFKVMENLFVAINMGLKYFPIVDSGLSRRSGIDQDRAAGQFFRGH